MIVNKYFHHSNLLQMFAVFFLFILLVESTDAQEVYNVQFTIDGVKDRTAHIYSIKGEKVSLLDSIVADKNNSFNFLFVEKQNHIGMYRLRFDGRRNLDFIFENENINIKTSATAIYDSITVIESESNKLFYEFGKLNRTFKQMTEVFQYVLLKYPQKDDYYIASLVKLESVQRDYQSFIASQRNNTFIGRYINSMQLPIIDYTMNIEAQLKYLKTRGLDKIDFNDELLTNSDLFSSKSIEYLFYFRNPQLPKELLEKEFMSAVDSILLKARLNANVYKHIVEYLIDGFRQFGFDLIIDYIVDKYVIADDICLDAKLQNSIQRRIDQSKFIKIGSTAPEISLPDKTGKKFSLSGVKNKKLLVIFYSSKCPHCITFVPQVFEKYKNGKSNQTEVVAISMDERKDDWLSFINEKKFTWHDLHDEKGWDGDASNKYFIYATPSLFLYDANKKLIAKPITIEEVESYF